MNFVCEIHGKYQRVWGREGGDLIVCYECMIEMFNNSCCTVSNGKLKEVKEIKE